MGALFSKPKVPPPPPPLPDPTVLDPSIEEARRRARLADRKRKGRAATILTSPSGAGSGDAATLRKRLGGS